VKLRLCTDCGSKLNYKRRRDKEKEQKRALVESRIHDDEEKQIKKRRECDEGSQLESEKETNERIRTCDTTVFGGLSSLKQEGARQSLEYSKEYASEMWTRPIVLESEKSNEEEMDSFFADLLQ
jgi:hypothetical protein